MLSREIVGASIVGFSPLVREGICRVLSDSEFRHYHIHETVEHVTNSLSSEESPLVLIDLKPTDDSFSGLTLLKARSPAARVVVMAQSFDLKQMVGAFKADADAYLLKEIESHPLLDSLRLVMRGEKVIPGVVLQHLPDIDRMTDSRAEVELQLSELLSVREIDTLHCLVMGYANKVIAYRLNISEATVKVHVKAILRKLTVQNRTQAALWAVNQGIVNQLGGFRDYPEAVEAYEKSPAAHLSQMRFEPSLALASGY